MSIFKDETSPRCCTACGSAVCNRDDACPSCATCGKRGHLSCTSGLEAVTVPKIEEAPEIQIGVGVDKVAGQVTLDFECKHPTKPLKVRVHFSDREVGELTRALVSAALSLRGQAMGQDRSLVVIPTKDGVPVRPARNGSTLKFPNPK